MSECFFLVPAHPGSLGQRAIKCLLIVVVVVVVVAAAAAAAAAASSHNRTEVQCLYLSYCHQQWHVCSLHLQNIPVFNWGYQLTQVDLLKTVKLFVCLLYKLVDALRYMDCTCITGARECSPVLTAINVKNCSLSPS